MELNCNNHNVKQIAQRFTEKLAKFWQSTILCMKLSDVLVRHFNNSSGHAHAYDLKQTALALKRQLTNKLCH